MRVALLVGERMMTTMGGDPIDQGTLKRHGSRDRENDLQWPDGYETLMREQAMETNRHPKTGERIEEEGYRCIDDREAAPPQGDDRRDEPAERDQGDDQDRETLPSHALGIERLNSGDRSGDIHMDGLSRQRIDRGGHAA